MPRNGLFSSAKQAFPHLRKAHSAVRDSDSGNVMERIFRKKDIYPDIPYTHIDILKDFSASRGMRRHAARYLFRDFPLSKFFTAATRFPVPIFWLNRNP